MSETNHDHSKETYDLEEGSGEERIADQLKKSNWPRKCGNCSAKESTDPVKQPKLGNLAVPEAKQKSTAATSNRTKILHQNYKT